MSKIISVLIVLALSVSILVGCEQNSSTKLSEAKIDSLKSKLDSMYIPGTGEIMNGIIQPHHIKLWMAGQNENWTLAEYERHLLLGGFNRIQKYHKGTTVADMVPMIYPVMDTIKEDIMKKDLSAFNRNYLLLTNTCNTCHQATKYEFNVIKVPTGSDFADQAL